MPDCNKLDFLWPGPAAIDETVSCDLIKESISTQMSHWVWAYLSSRRTKMAKATWAGKTIADSNSTVVVEGNQYFPPETVEKNF